MEYLRGRSASVLDSAAFGQLCAGYEHVLLDLGTGDGRFVQYTARTRPTWLVVGIDSCRENLRGAARKTPANGQYVIANALALPRSLHGVASQITINFPWGSLLHGLLESDAGLLAGLVACARPGAHLDVYLNAGALVESGWSLEAGGAQVRSSLLAQGFSVQPARMLDNQALRAYPSSWAKRLAFGRDPRALHIQARR